MELSLLEATHLTGMSVRSLQHAAAAGDLPVQRVEGRTQMVDELVLRAFMRSQGQGRRWSDPSYHAALDMLSGRQTREHAGPELARLRGALRGLDAAAMAHRFGASSGWYRYSSPNCSPVGVAHRVSLTGPSALENPRVATMLDLPTRHSDILFGTARNLRKVAEKCTLVLDSEGDMFLKVMYHPPIVAAVVIHLYLFGEDVESQAAARDLERMAADL